MLAQFGKDDLKKSPGLMVITSIAKTDEVPKLMASLGISKNPEGVAALALFLVGVGAYSKAGNSPFPNFNVNTMTLSPGVLLNSVDGESQETISDEDKSFQGMFIAYYPSCSGTFVELCTAKALGKLTESHIESYYTAKGTDGISGVKILKVITMFSHEFKAAGEDILEFVRQEEWGKYRTNASSTPQLMNLFKTGQRGIYDIVIGDEDDEAMVAALAAPHDLNLSKNISAAAIMATAGYLEACGILPKKWYQFEKAKTAASPHIMIMVSDATSRMIQLQNKTAAVKGATSSHGVLRALRRAKGDTIAHDPDLGDKPTEVDIARMEGITEVEILKEKAKLHEQVLEAKAILSSKGP